MAEIKLFKKAYLNKEGKTRYCFYLGIGSILVPISLQYYKTDGKGNENNDKYNFANYKTLLAFAEEISTNETKK